MYFLIMQSLANNFGKFTAVVPPLLNSIDLIHRVVGPRPLEFISQTLNKMSGNLVPVWSPAIPKVLFHLGPSLDVQLVLICDCRIMLKKMQLFRYSVPPSNKRAVVLPAAKKAPSCVSVHSSAAHHFTLLCLADGAT